MATACTGALLAHSAHQWMVGTQSDYEYSRAVMPDAALASQFEAEIPIERMGSRPGQLIAMALDVERLQGRVIARRILIDPSALTPGTDLLEGLETPEVPGSSGR